MNRTRTFRKPHMIERRQARRHSLQRKLAWLAAV